MSDNILSKNISNPAKIMRIMPNETTVVLDIERLCQIKKQTSTGVATEKIINSINSFSKKTLTIPVPSNVYTRASLTSLSLFGLQANKFKPLDITTREQQIFKQQAKEINQNFDNVNYTMPYDPTAVRTVNQLKNIMRRIPYGQNFYDYINPQDWRMDKEWKPEGQPTVPVTGKQQSFNIAPVNTPNVNPQTVTPNPQQTVASQNEFQRAFPQG